MLQGRIGPEHGAGVAFGVAFGTQQTSESVGRRVAVREFVGREEPATQDLGRKARRYRVQAVLLGSEYVNDYNDLINELERPGRKRLRHPILGDKIVRIPEQQLSISLTSSGRADITFDVVEAGPREPLLILVDDYTTPVVNARAARDADAAARVSFLDKVGAFAQTLLSKVSAANSALRGVKYGINARMAVVDDLAHQIDQLDDNLSDLADTPGEIARSFGNLTKQVIDLARNTALTSVSPVLAVFDAIETLVDFGDNDRDVAINGTLNPRSEEREAFAVSLNAIIDMVRTSAVIELAGAIPDLGFDSAQEVRALRLRMFDMVQKSIGSAGMSGDLTTAVGKMWTTVESYMSQQAQNLPQAVKWRVPEVMPILLIAQELYGDPTRAPEIIRRNRALISNPSFVPAGIDLEVLSA